MSETVNFALKNRCEKHCFILISVQKYRMVNSVSTGNNVRVSTGNNVRGVSTGNNVRVCTGRNVHVGSTGCNVHVGSTGCNVHG